MQTLWREKTHQQVIPLDVLCVPNTLPVYIVGHLILERLRTIVFRIHKHFYYLWRAVDSFQIDTMTLQQQTLVLGATIKRLCTFVLKFSHLTVSDQTSVLYVDG